MCYKWDSPTFVFGVVVCSLLSCVNALQNIQNIYSTMHISTMNLWKGTEITRHEVHTIEELLGPHVYTMLVVSYVQL
jgi:hypothetical protein